MKNVIICNNCEAENPFYSLNCIKCHGFLRSKIPNVDFWSTVSNLLTSPVRAAENIIFSEHKNLLFILLILTGFKLTINIWIFHQAIDYLEINKSDYLRAIILGAATYILTLVILSFLVSQITTILKIKNRFADYLAIYTYSFFPLIITFFVLTPIQLALFGLYWFTFNPSPFLVKELPAYIMVFIEGLFLLWAFFLLITSTYAQTKSKIFSMVVGLVLFVLVITSIHFSLIAVL